MKEWEKWGFIGSPGRYSHPPKNFEDIEISYTIFFGSTRPKAKELLGSSAGKIILEEAGKHQWDVYRIAMEMQNYADYLEEQKRNGKRS